jgi:hypothetical protein
MTKWRLLSRLTGSAVPYEQMHEQVVNIPYTGERRLITNRNVVEVKQPFEARCLYSTVERPMGERYAAVVGLTILGVLSFAMKFFPEQFTPEVAFYGPLAVCMLVIVACWQILNVSSEVCVVINYVPHLVSAVVHEYDRGTGAVSVRSSLRMRIRRLAAFPLPDFDTNKFVAGTEEMCLQVMTEDGFFWEGAACFTLPR